MAKRCYVCGKGPMAGNNVSHSQRHTTRRFLPNLQSVKIAYKGTAKRVRVCTSCLKAGKVERVA